MDYEFVESLNHLRKQAQAADQASLAYLIGLAELEAERIKGADGAG